MSGERAIIQYCIDAIAEQRGIMDVRAEHEAKHERYSVATEFQTLGRGLKMATEALEELKKEASWQS